jgi:uracil-DNA glycosylase
MQPSRSAQLEAWLRWADDLGLGPFALDRAPRVGLEALTGSPSGSPSAEAGVGFPLSASGVSAPLTGLEATPHAPLPPSSLKPAAASAFTPSAAGTSLFEEHIENDTLERVRSDIGPDCTRCKLHKARRNIVFGVGNPNAELVFVGEGPGHDEDVQGEPFVGRAGRLLTQMIEAMGLGRSDVYICNVVKCRPPENRLPEKDEIATCSPYLIRQLDVIQPKVICCLGACSAQTLLNTTQGISRYRGEWFDYRGARLMATYHPAYLLRNPAAKSEVWKDLKKIMAVLGLQPKRR